MNKTTIICTGLATIACLGFGIYLIKLGNLAEGSLGILLAFYGVYRLKKEMNK